MNQADYASLGICKRLVDAGIVLETEKVWVFNAWPLTIDGHVTYEEIWLIINKPMIRYREQYPAPSMAEAWRELRKYLPTDKEVVCAIQEMDDWISDTARVVVEVLSDTNKLCELLMWVMGREK